MSHLAMRLIALQSDKLKRESRRLRNQAETHRNEHIAQFIRRRSWDLMAHSRKILETLGEF